MDKSEFQKRTSFIVEALKKEISSLRSNRPTSKLVEDIKVEYFDQLLPIKQLASISIVPPREIDINVWDKNAVSPVIKAIENSPIGLTANTDGSLIRLNLPPLSEERRQELIKAAKKITEDFRIQIRHARDEFNKLIAQEEKDGLITEDQLFKQKTEIQKITDSANQEIEKSLNDKVRELSE